LYRDPDELIEMSINLDESLAMSSRHGGEQASPLGAHHHRNAHPSSTLASSAPAYSLADGPPRRTKGGFALLPPRRASRGLSPLMIAIPTRAQATLTHRAYFVVVSSTGDVLAVSPEGECTLLGPDLSTRARFQCAPKPTAVALSAAHGRIAVCSAWGLSIRDLEGRETHAVPIELGAGCLFAPEHDLLWTIHPVDLHTFELGLRDGSNGRLLKQQRFSSPEQDASPSLHPHPSSRAVTIWIAAGQDGQWLFWGREDGTGIQIAPLAGVDRCALPAFAPGGQALLLLEGSTLARWSTDGSDRTAVVTEGPWLQDDDYLVESLAWLTNDRAVTATNEGRLWLVDPWNRRIVDEAYVQGHAPGPIGTIWPELARETGIASNLSFFTGGSSGVVSVHFVPLRAGGPLEAVHLAAWDVARIGW
jgi:hypothetical protein